MLTLYYLLLFGFVCNLPGGSSKAKEKLFYDTYTGVPISKEVLKQFDKSNSTFWCTIEVKDCNENEGRRLDGTCNNLRHPSRGASHTPFYRILEPDFDRNFGPRKAKSGGDLPLARRVRTRLLSEGRVPDSQFTQLFTHYIVFMSSDVAALHDTVNYILWIPYCCTPKGKTNPMCAPNYIPDDDPVHRFSNIRCLNMTRPISFQSSGCLPKDTIPERINTATPVFDLSTLYGSVLNSSLSKGRLFKGGLLKYEEVHGHVWPPSSKGPGVCLLNQKHETRCHDTPDDGTNTLLGLNIFSIWFWRHHNMVANMLAEINPCWNDERIFQTARDINIATALQMYYYEMLPDFLGRQNLLMSKVLIAPSGFRDIYNENVIPQVTLEYPFVLRWLHTMQEGNLKMYDNEGNFLKNFPLVNLTLRTGYLAVDDNLAKIAQGSFRQASGKIDYIVDPDMAEIGLGPHQLAADIFTNDLAKNRYFGFPAYVKYKEYCFGRKYTTFEDLSDSISPERIEILSEVYEHVEDIDLIAGLWVEDPMPNGKAPATFYCLVVDQLVRAQMSDRHWYERPNRPNAFSAEQLQEIRKVSMAGFMCDVADSVTRIQRKPFLRISKGNELCDCNSIHRIDLRAWKDLSCARFGR